MMYILDQRLHAQNVLKDKTSKVVNDIVSTMFSKHFIDEMFRPQLMYSKRTMRSVFDRLAHSSLLRLNAASMDKLYDLMIMVVKQQVLMCLRPKDILFITLNHLDAIMELVKDNPSTLQQVNYVYRLFIKVYADLSDGEFQLLRQTMLTFFQDCHIRVTVFLKEKVQNNDGLFVLPRSGVVGWNIEIPVVIKLFDENSELIKTTSSNPGGRYIPSSKEGSIEPKGDRCTQLGRNIYVDKCIETSGGKGRIVGNTDLGEPSSSDADAIAQLQLLSCLIGMASTSQKPEMQLNLFGSGLLDEDEDNYEDQPTPEMEKDKSMEIKIDASKKQSCAELDRIMGEMSLETSVPSSDGDDLLELMDSAL